MPTFKRKQAATIDAEQYTPTHTPRGVQVDCVGQPHVVTIHNQKCCVVHGDWIAAEMDGVHYYPIKDHVFRATYEPVVAALEEQGVEELPSSEALLWVEAASANEARRTRALSRPVLSEEKERRESFDPVLPTVPDA